MWTLRGVRERRVSATTTAVSRVILGASPGEMVGLRIREIYIPPRGGENQVLPFLPLPVVWASEITRVPSGEPIEANSLAFVLVESISSK